MALVGEAYLFSHPPLFGVSRVGSPSEFPPIGFCGPGFTFYVSLMCPVCVVSARVSILSLYVHVLNPVIFLGVGPLSLRGTARRCHVSPVIFEAPLEGPSKFWPGSFFRKGGPIRGQNPL